MSDAEAWLMPEPRYALICRPDRRCQDLVLHLSSSADVHHTPAQSRCQHLQIVGPAELDAQNARDQVLHGGLLVVSSYPEDRNRRDVRGELAHLQPVPLGVPPGGVLAQRRLAGGHPHVREQTGDPAAGEGAGGVVVPLVELFPEVAQVDLQSGDVAVDRVQDAADHVQVALQRGEQVAELFRFLPEQLPVLGRALDLDVRDLAARRKLVGVVRAGGLHEGGDESDALLGVHSGQRRCEELAESPSDGVRQLVVEPLVQIGLVPVVGVDDAWSVDPVRSQQLAVTTKVLADVLADLADDGVPEHLGPQAEPQMGGVRLVGALDQQARCGGLSAEGCRGQAADVVRADIRDAGDRPVADLLYGVRTEHTGQEGGVGASGSASGSSPFVGNADDVGHEVSWRLKVHCGVAAEANPGG